MKRVVIKDASFGYDQHIVVQDFSVEIAGGEIVGFFGANGSGKSTVLKTIAGVIPRLSGMIEINGNVVFVPQRKCIFDELTIRQQISILTKGKYADQFGGTFHRIVSRWMPPPRLDRPGKSFSSGEQRMIGLALSLVRTPDILLLDEPFAPLRESLIEPVMNDLIHFAQESAAAILIAEQKIRHIGERLSHAYRFSAGYGELLP